MASTDGNQIVPLLDLQDTKEIIERNRQNDWQDLEPYQRAFAYSFLVDYNHRKAAEAAGRSADSGLSILRHPLVDAFIQDLQKQQATNSFITKEYITTQYINMIPIFILLMNIKGVFFVL